MVHVFLLCNGLGVRFREQNYLFPKPLIYVHGKPLIFYSIEEILKCSNVILYILYNQRLEEFEFYNTIRHYFRQPNIKYLKLDNTSGPAETIYRGLEAFNIHNGPFISIDCDILFSYKNLQKFIKYPRNLLFYFVDKQPGKMFSYIKKRRSQVLEVREKVRISDFACCGLYGIEEAADYRKSFNAVNSNKLLFEFCPSLIYQHFIDIKKKVYCQLVHNYTCLGTPNLLKEYCLKTSNKEKKRFCFDVDNTLFSFSGGNYKDIKPISKNIELLRKLFNDGHTVILYTARGNLTFSNNIGLINTNVLPVLFETLKKYDIPYHEIYLGKPHADFYIDDLAVNSFDDIQKYTGFYFN